jgi:hypothetical protein
MKNWNEYSREHYLFLLAQGELLLKETNETMKSISSRSRFQLLISLSLITGNISWLINSQLEGYNLYSITIITLLSISVYYDIRALWRYQCWTVGSSPIKMINENLLIYQNTDDDEKAIIYNVCQICSDRIDFNINTNIIRIRYSTIAFSFICFVPVSLIFIYFLSSYLC